MPKLLLVGCGLTSSVIASILRTKYNKGLQLVVWDKSNTVGGRMRTVTSPNDPLCQADLGAQYFTAMPEYQHSHKAQYGDLLASSILNPFTGKFEGLLHLPPGTRHFIAPEGSASVVNYFFKEGGADINLEHHVNEMSVVDKGGKKQWQVTTNQGKADCFDGVVLTMPVPQILALHGDIEAGIDKHAGLRQQLEAVRYSSRFALGLFYDKSVKFPEHPWSAKYWTGDHAIRFVAIDNIKRGANPLNTPYSVVVHTRVEFGLKYLEEEKDEVQPLILNRLQALMPNLPPPSTIRSHKWTYSQVDRMFPGRPGCLLIQEDPPLVLAGDGFTYSNFDGCVDSAIKSSETISKCLKA